jgi:hypothetical protein
LQQLIPINALTLGGRIVGAQTTYVMHCILPKVASQHSVSSKRKYVLAEVGDRNRFGTASDCAFDAIYFVAGYNGEFKTYN